MPEPTPPLLTLGSKVMMYGRLCVVTFIEPRIGDIAWTVSIEVISTRPQRAIEPGIGPGARDRERPL